MKQVQKILLSFDSDKNILRIEIDANLHEMGIGIVKAVANNTKAMASICSITALLNTSIKLAKDEKVQGNS